MADREQPYDPYIPSGGQPNQGGPGGQNGNHRTAALQAVSDIVKLSFSRCAELSSPVDTAAEVSMERPQLPLRRWHLQAKIRPPLNRNV